MGNKLARTTQVSPSEYYLHDLPSSYNLVLKEALGGGRFLKSIQCVHDEGLLLVKVYFKRGEFINLKVCFPLSTTDFCLLYPLSLSPPTGPDVPMLFLALPSVLSDFYSFSNYAIQYVSM
jgi:hypothetical protein